MNKYSKLSKEFSLISKSAKITCLIQKLVIQTIEVWNIIYDPMQKSSKIHVFQLDMKVFIPTARIAKSIPM